MDQATLIFNCPNCDTRLKVPTSMAGKQGPCPACKATLTAPAPGDRPAKGESSSAPHTKPLGSSAVSQLDLARAKGPKSYPGVTSSVPKSRKSLPFREEKPRTAPAVEPIGKVRSTEDETLRMLPDTPPRTARAQVTRNQRPLRAVVLGTSILIIGLLGWLIFFPSSPKQSDPTKNHLSVDSTGIPHSKRPPAPTELEAPPSRPEQLSTVESRHLGPDNKGIEDEQPESPGEAADKLLDAFLAAKDAASRVTMISPLTSEAELAATLLKGPLPKVSQIFSDLPRYHPATRRTDYPYRVSFLVPGKPNAEYAVLVQQEGNRPPKVHLPAFLDLVGGRLAGFTERPNKRPSGVFHVILEPIPGCQRTTVPNPADKFTFKLLSSPFGHETARAHAAIGSSFHQIVENPASPIRWGTRVRATITIRWNHTENPAQPYLEVINLNSPDWNP